jgi:hypothetical protein
MSSFTSQVNKGKVNWSNGWSMALVPIDRVQTASAAETHRIRGFQRTQRPHPVASSRGENHGIDAAKSRSRIASSDRL